MKKRKWPNGLIAVSIAHRYLEDCLRSLTAAIALGADIIEFRFDQMEESCRKYFLEHYPTLRGEYGRDVKFILTYRRADHGGPEDVTHHNSLNFWIEAFRHYPDAIKSAFLIDWEWELVKCMSKQNTLGGTEIPWDSILVSRHNMELTPSEAALSVMLKEMSESRAAAMKFAFMSHGEDDNRRILDLYRLNVSGKPMLAIGMGVVGLETRLSWLKYKALLTFARITDKGSAPGQPTLQELLSLRTRWRSDGS